MEPRGHSPKNLVQILLNEPTFDVFEKEQVIDYIHRLCKRLTGENLLSTIGLEESQLKALIESIIAEIDGGA